MYGKKKQRYNVRATIGALSNFAAAKGVISRQAAARSGLLSKLRGTEKGLGLMARPGGRPAPEVKAFDVVSCTTNPHYLPLVGAVVLAEPNVNSFGGGFELNHMVQGANYYNRVGTKVTIKSIQVRAQVYAGTTTTMSVVRCMLVYDRQPNGTFPAMADVLLDSGGNTFFHGPMNLQNRSRFLMLRDEVISVDPAQHLENNVNWYVKGRWDSEYKASAGSIGDIATGALYFIAYSMVDQTVYLYNFESRIRYFD